MKKIVYSIFVCMLVILTSCQDKTSYDDTKITNYVTFSMKGEKIFLLPVGTAFVEPGVIAKEGSKDVTSAMVVDGTVDGNTIGLYEISYSAVNADGYASSTKRQVIVYNPAVTTDISGSYICVAPTHRLRSGATVNFSGYNVDIKYIAPGIFSVSDFFAGYYDVRAKYGSAYAMTGFVKLNPDNTISLLSSHIAGWGDGLDNLNNGVYNTTSHVVNWEAGYAGSMTFFVTLNKK